jgi:lipoic acid synthetase
MVRSSFKAGEFFVEALLREGKSVEEAREAAASVASEASDQRAVNAVNRE